MATPWPGWPPAARRRGAALVQVSTDYVFDGLGREPYPEDGLPAPRTAYGRTKLAGERAVLEQAGLAGYVVRTAWLYGVHGPSFVATMIRKEREQAQVHVVDDQRGQPTWSMDVADRIHALIASAAPPGIYHATSSGETTWFGLAQEVFRLLGADPARVRPAKSSSHGPARRRGPRTACSATPPGAGPGSPRSAAGSRRCSAACPARGSHRRGRAHLC